jgi:hypothetical protein
MKLSQTISIEQKYGKYLFDNKIKKNNLISKTTIKEEKTISKKNFESDINEIKEEKKKFIQIIQSFEDPSISDITLENLAFLSDIKSPDSKFTIHLKEELPKIRHEDIKSEFLSNALNEVHDDINLIDLKKNYIIEPLINKYKYKNYENINNINISEKKIEKKDDKRKQKNDEDEEIMKNKRKVIIKALIYFNKDNIVNGIENFKRRIPDLNKSKFEKDNTFEKNVYSKIEDRIREYLNKYKCEKLSQLRDFENNYIMKIINFQKKSLNYKYIFIKGIIIGLINIINDWLGKEYLRSLEDNQANNDKDDFILDCYEKYEILKKICYFLEKDFSLFIDNFKDNNKLEFKFINLFSDIFWDYVFRIKDINIYFTKNCVIEKLDEKVNETMNNITNILYNIDLSYKKMFGDLLNITCIKSENIFLMDYVIKYRNPSNNKNVNLKENKNINNINERKENNELHKSSSYEMILNNKIDCIENNKRKKEEKEEDNKNIINDNKEDNKNNSNNISEDISTNDYYNNINKSYNDIEDNKMDLNLGKSYSMDICNNKLNDKDSLEKVYNYILYGENEKKKQKKKHKKRRKNKNSNSIIMEENIDPIDPIVEEYKNYINNIYKNRSGYIKKIKPKINQEWINSLTFPVD